MQQSLGPSCWLKKKWECWFLPVRIYGIAAYRHTSNISELDAFSSLHSRQVCHPWLLSLPRPCPGIAVSCDGIVPFCPQEEDSDADLPKNHSRCPRQLGGNGMGWGRDPQMEMRGDYWMQ